jgi:uncharacterized membrane protein SpoIIM required for sporulation
MPEESLFRFVNERKNAWQRLEDLLLKLDRTRLKNLNREEVRELGQIYRRTASDLAIARVESRDPRLVNYLNSLVIRAHGRIYRAESRGGVKVKNFFIREFPRTVRAHSRFVILSALIFFIFSFFSFYFTRSDPDFSELAGVQPSFRENVIERRVHWWKQLNEASEVGASFIMTNNIGVTFYAFALGALFGIGTLYILASNGLSIGAILALTNREGYSGDLVTFMIGHGVVELSCIFISGAAGLLLGTALILPGDYRRSDVLRLKGMDAIRLLVGCIPLLVLAGIIEGYISPSNLQPGIKYGTGLVSGLLLYTYLLLAGRGDRDES